MAFQSYSKSESINDMTTRQLRKYVSEQGAEAQKYLDTLAESDRTQSIKDSIHFITKGTGNKVYRGTSNLSKAEMKEMAHQIRIFNKLAVASEYAQQQDYETNKARYEKFLNNRSKDDYWKQFIKDGKGTREGYDKYKMYVAMLIEIAEVSQYFNYKTLLSRATKQLMTGQKVGKRMEAMSKIINDIYSDSQNEGLQSKQLTDKFFQAWYDYEEKEALKHTVTKADIKGKPTKYKPKSIPSSKRKKQRSSSNVKTKTVGKMKTNVPIPR